MARGVRAIRFSGKEKKEEWKVCRDDESAIEIKKNNRRREAKRKESKLARTCRRVARLMREGEKVLRRRMKHSR